MADDGVGGREEGGESLLRLPEKGWVDRIPVRNLFCLMHQYLDRHDCSVDYKVGSRGDKARSVDYKAGSRGDKARKSNKTPSTPYQCTRRQIHIQKSQYQAS
ncbi:hypothetical protein RHGRI_014173 [Rhododendron griersonianum]|uniref:Uncharacterized protein n=1 Tax=Rhododendron griersonianum TaxID=479676 RepID=A0AAV6K8C9_9ERIC|nr:hypothetical protein RHGRI_014173 [Rhododendron griersonianum]